MSAAHPIAQPQPVTPSHRSAVVAAPVTSEASAESQPPLSERTRVHPAGLYILSAAEACERFGCYLLLALFTLYLNEHYGFSQERAINWYGWYLSAVYFTPLIGGWLGGRWLERRTWVLLGAITLGLGYSLLSMGTPTTLLAAIGVLTLGNGLFKPNISTLVGSLYKPGDSRRDEAFGIFYVAVNVGAMIAPVAGETMRYRLGWGPSFLSAAGALALAVLILTVGMAYLPSRAGSTAESSQSPTALGVGTDRRQRMLALLLFCLMAVPFWMAYYQTGGSVTYFARDNVQRILPWSFFDLREIPPGAFASLGGMFVLLLTVPLSWVVRRLRRAGLTISSADKVATGLFFASLAFALLSAIAHFAVQGRVNALWLVAFYFVLTVAELLLSPVGLSLVSKLSPQRWVGLMMGVWYLATTCGNRLSGQVAPLWSQWSHSRFFGGLSVVLFSAAVFLVLQLRWLRRVLPPEHQ